MNLKGKSFLKLLDLTPEEIGGLLELAADFKAKKKAGISHKIHDGKNIVLLFEKDSTRTRCSFGRTIGGVWRQSQRYTNDANCRPGCGS